MQKMLLYFLSLGLLLSFSCSCSGKDEEYPPKDIVTNEIQLNRNWDLYTLYLPTNLDSALYYGKEIQRIAHASGENKWLASSHEAIAHIQYQQGFLGDAALNYFEAAKIYKEAGYLSNLANVYNSLGAVYSIAEDNNTAISYYSKAKDILYYEGTSKKKSFVFLNIAICYQELGFFIESQEMLAQAMQAATEANEFSLVSKINNNHGVILSLQGMHDKARESYLLSLANIDSLSDRLKIQATAYNNIGKTYLDEGNITEAENYLNKALSLKKEIGDPYFMLSTLNYLAEIEIKRNKPEVAVGLLEQGLNEVDLKVIEEETGKGISLIMEALFLANKNPHPSARNLNIEKLATYSKKLVFYNNNLLAVKEQIENTSKRQSLQLAEEKFNMGEELKEEQEKNAEIKFAFIIPLLFLICALLTTYYTFQKNKRMRKVIDTIDLVINKKSIRG